MNKKINKMMIVDLFNKFNKEYFNDELPMPTIYINQSRKALGMCGYKHKDGKLFHYIKISNFYDRPMHDVETTLIHEMIHLYFHNKRMFHVNHGKEFQEMARSMDKYGYDIHTQSKVDYKVEDKIPLRFFAKIHNPTNGMITLCCLATSKLNTWVERLRYCGWEVEFFKSNSAIFGGYSVCQSVLRGHPFSPHTFETEALPYLIKCDMSELN